VSQADRFISRALDSDGAHGGAILEAAAMLSHQVRYAWENVSGTITAYRHRTDLKSATTMR